MTAELLLFHGMLRPPWPWVSNPPSKPRYGQDSLPNTYYNELPWSMLPLHTRRTPVNRIAHTNRTVTNPSTHWSILSPVRFAIFWRAPLFKIYRVIMNDIFNSLALSKSPLASLVSHPVQIKNLVRGPLIFANSAHGMRTCFQQGYDRVLEEPHCQDQTGRMRRGPANAEEYGRS